jgi:hypothetical protein
MIVIGVQVHHADQRRLVRKRVGRCVEASLARGKAFKLLSWGQVPGYVDNMSEDPLGAGCAAQAGCVIKWIFISNNRETLTYVLRITSHAEWQVSLIASVHGI